MCWVNDKNYVGSRVEIKHKIYFHHFKLQNATYIDKAENMIRLPAITNYYQKKSMKKPFKKSPRRTIQKIIKKNTKTKIKKVYVVRKTPKPTVVPKQNTDNDDEYASRNAEMTTRPNQQKKIRKYNIKQVKLPRYPMPFRQMQRKNTYKRSKRDTPNLFIFKDFDSMEVFHKGKKDENDYNVVNAHFKKYW